MQIRVYDDMENEIYQGEADDFLYDNEADSELELILSQVERGRIGQAFEWSDFIIVKDYNYVSI